MPRKKAVAAVPATGVPRSAPAPVRRPPRNRFVRWGVNLWVVFHFAAVLAAASSVGPTSDLVIAVWRPFRPYLQALYLNHGYSFYAPEPSPSTLVRYEVERSDGTVARGFITDVPMRPRLLYQRYLLLTEHMGLASPNLFRDWYKSYARHLCHKYGGSRVGLTQVIHYPPTMEMVRGGAGLKEPFNYDEMFAGDFACGEL
jgi:hypothetical protein